MNCALRIRLFSIVLLTLCCVGLSQAMAGNVEITRAFSGVWDQTDHQSQGFILQITDTEDDAKIGVVYWFTYDEDLTPAWYLAVGPVVENEIQMILYKSSGVAFLQSGLEGDPDVEEIGTLLMSFHNCNQGTVTYETSDEELGSGELNIRRLTSLYRMRCSGGISDDVPGDARPLQLELELLPPDENGEGKGKAKFQERPGRSSLHVTVEGLPDGSYSLKICEEPEGDIEVEDGEGSIQFRSPAIPAHELLNFEPRECIFDVYSGENLVLTSGEGILAEKAKGPDNNEGTGDDDEIEAGLQNTGVEPSAKGSASYEVDDDRTHFKVRIMDVAPGDYPLYVDGNEEGVITVVEGPGPDRGELRFSNPQHGDDELLDFVPLGALIQVYNSEDVVILEVTFPDA